jgi:hypothetical protein
MELSKEQQAFYQSARDHCHMEVHEMNRTIRAEWQHLNDEIKRVQGLIETLETRKQTVGQMYASASEMLGAENDLDISSPIQENNSEAEDLGVGEIDL